MYSSVEKPSCSSESLQSQYQYHLNAFNLHSTANTKTSTGATTLAPKSIGSAKLTVRPSTDAHKQSSTILNNNRDRNNYSNGAYTSTCSNNNFENAKQNTRTMMFNEKM